MERLAGPWEEARQRLEEAKQAYAKANRATGAAPLSTAPDKTSLSGGGSIGFYLTGRH